MRTIKFVVAWLRRIPLRFTVVFVGLMLLFLVVVSRVVTPEGVATLGDLVLGIAGVPDEIARRPIVRVGLDGFVVLALLLAAALAAYNLSALAYRWIRRRPRIRVVGPTAPTPGDGTRLDDFHRIGLILAGGGAKGAYQAGAMKAIYEFLEENDALDRVGMIAGTSIGSWNAMFWLADLIKPSGPDEASMHEAWWRSINVRRIVEFDTYLPLRANHFLRSRPWQEMFRGIFVDPPEVRGRLSRLFVGADEGDAGDDPAIHFYLTRTNVEAGHLEFATNWPGIATKRRPRLGASDSEARELMVEPDRYEVIAGTELADALHRTRRAVFASMDLPPLFPYMKIKVDRAEWFEDGGVVENIPVRFGTQIEGCDLLFILPLNASFAEPVNLTSVTQRLFRVMDVRQGVMERAALKMVYLYNELAALRGAVREGERAPSGPGAELEQTALRREHRPVSVFAICPEAPLAIGTAEFWKPRAAGEAFDLMYAATKYELLENFEKSTDPSWIRMTLVSPQGERSYVDDF